MATAAIYARYSSAGQREESIEDQVRVCRAAIEAAGDVVGHVYEDRATTGTTTDRRAGFMRMVADAQRGCSRPCTCTSSTASRATGTTRPCTAAA